MAVAAGCAVLAIVATQSYTSEPLKSRYLPEYAAPGELILPKKFHEWL
jgi:hypothetical protein